MGTDWVQVVECVQRILIGVGGPAIGGLLIAYGVAKLRSKSNESVG